MNDAQLETLIDKFANLMTRVCKLFIRGRLDAEQRKDVAAELRKLADEFEQ